MAPKSAGQLPQILSFSRPRESKKPFDSSRSDNSNIGRSSNQATISREERDKSSEDNELSENIQGDNNARPTTSQVKVDRETSPNFQTPDTVVAKVQPARRVERKVANGPSDFSPIRRLKDISNSKFLSQDVPVPSEPASDSSNAPAISSEKVDQSKIEYHENMQDRIRDRKDSSKAKEVRESTERAEQHSLEKVEKNLVRKKQQKSRSLQRRSIQSNSSFDSEAVPHIANDSCTVLSNSAMQFKGEQENEKTADAPQSAAHKHQL